MKQQNAKNEALTTLEDKQQYQSWVEELRKLEAIDWDGDNTPDPEYVTHRIQCLRADILAYEEAHAIIASSGATKDMDDGEYWNTIALANDEWNGDL